MIGSVTYPPIPAAYNDAMFHVAQDFADGRTTWLPGEPPYREFERLLHEYADLVRAHDKEAACPST